MDSCDGVDVCCAAVMLVGVITVCAEVLRVGGELWPDVTPFLVIVVRANLTVASAVPTTCVVAPMVAWAATPGTVWMMFDRVRPKLRRVRTGAAENVADRKQVFVLANTVKIAVLSCITPVAFTYRFCGLNHNVKLSVI